MPTLPILNASDEDDGLPFDLDHVSACPACGDPMDYCTGHGPIGHPGGFAILTAHDEGDHEFCHPAAECAEPEEVVR